MKLFRPNINLLIVLGLLLMIITVGQAYLEYRSSRAAVLNLFRNQAESIINNVASAGEKGLLAYKSFQRQTKERLYVIAESVDRLILKDSNADDEINDIISKYNLSHLAVFNSDAAIIAGNLDETIADSDMTFWQTRLSPIIEDKEAKLDLGFFREEAAGIDLFAVAVKSRIGGAIVVGIDPAELILLGRSFGAGSAIEDVSRNLNVEYSAIINNGTILARSNEFPNDRFENWLGTSNQRDSIITRLIDYGTNTKEEQRIFEAAGPFYVADQYYGHILIGINTDYLDRLTSKLKRDIGWNAVFSLIITLIAIAGVILRQNYKSLSKNYDEIKLEVQKLEADKAIKEKLTAMGELAAGVAHEIRNPLNAIRVIIQRLRREFIPKADQEEYAELTDIVKLEVDKINTSIGQFLSLAKPANLDKSKADLNKCIAGQLKLIESQASASNIKLNSEFASLPDLELDIKLCGQAILNILENALAAIGENGIIEVRTYKTGNKCILEIGDSGPGIPEESKSRVFDMYFTTKKTGTGMGLPTVLMIVREHGGTIDIGKSALGGALLKVELPIG